MKFIPRRKLLNRRRSVGLLLFSILVYMAPMVINPTVNEIKNRPERVAESFYDTAEDEGHGKQHPEKQKELENNLSLEKEEMKELSKTNPPIIQEQQKLQGNKENENINEDEDQMQIKFPDDNQIGSGDIYDNGRKENDDERKENDNMDLKKEEILGEESEEQNNANDEGVANNNPNDDINDVEEESQQGQMNVMEQELAESKLQEERVAEAVYNDLYGNVKEYLHNKNIQNLKNKDQNFDEQRNKTKGVKNNGTFPHNVLLLASMGRTGSSFLGGLLNSQHEVLYVFEPFHNLQEKHLLTEKSAVEGLRGIFTCNFPSAIMNFLRNNARFAVKAYYIECGRKSSCLKEKSLTRACQKKSISVVKTIRTRISWLEPLLNDDQVNMKVIHLVRDPRAALISGWDRGWNISAKRSCDNLEQDVENGLILSRKYPDKYMAIRYEDLCDSPWVLSRYIFSFLGYDKLPASTESFLKSSTAGRDSDNAYSIKRNTKRMPQKWRGDISGKHLQLIESSCSSSITRLGFHLFHNLSSVRNYSLPLYNDAYHNTLFKYDDE